MTGTTWEWFDLLRRLLGLPETADANDVRAEAARRLAEKEA